MKKFLQNIGTVSTLVIAGGMLWMTARGPLSLNAQMQATYPILGPCTGYEEDDFFEIPIDELSEEHDMLDAWKEQYDQAVEDIIQSQISNDNFNPKCDAESMSEFLEPTNEMKTIAEKLPPWRDTDDLDDLSRLDFAPVLQEHLRMYECAMVERTYFLMHDIAIELGAMYAGDPIYWQTVFNEYIDQRSKIISELRLARSSLHRALALLGGTERMRVLQAEVECIQRASLDIRNGISLGAEATSCMPRTWNAKDPLRDYDERQPPSGP